MREAQASSCRATRASKQGVAICNRHLLSVGDFKSPLLEAFGDFKVNWGKPASRLLFILGEIS
jgi:hypothetical protein